jgi:hypothetical protein
MKTDHLGAIGIDGRILKNVCFKGVDWIQLGKERPQWQNLVSRVINIQVQ